MMSVGPEPAISSAIAPEPTHIPQSTRRFSTTLGSRTSSSATVTTSSSSLSSATSSSSTCLHTAHRQNHNQSKLPAFRFTDLNTVKSPVGLGLPSLLQQHHQHLPPSPVSPNNPPNLGPQDSILTNQAAVPALGSHQGLCVGFETTGTEAATPLTLRQGSGQGQGPVLDNITPSASDPLHIPQNTRSRTATHPPSSGSAGPTAISQQGHHSALKQKQPEVPASAATRTSSSVVSSRPQSFIKPPRTRASTLQQQSRSVVGDLSSSSISASSSRIPGTLGGTAKSTPSTTVTTVKRPASFPASPSKKHVCPANTSPNNSVPTEAKSETPQGVAPPLHAPAPTPAPSLEPIAPVAPAPELAPSTHTSFSTPTTTTTTTTETSTPKPSTFITTISTKTQPPRRKPASLDSTPVILIADVSSPSVLPPQRRHTDTTQFLQTSRKSQLLSSTDGSTGGQRELLLPKTLHQQSSPPDEKRASTYLKRRAPPVSFKAPLSISTAPSATSPGASTPSTVTTPVRVPPIRGFRSSGSRRSLVLDMGSRTMRHYDNSSDDSPSFDSRENTLRALEGRNDYGQITPPHSMEHDGADQDDTTDMFLNIAGEESIRPSIEDGHGDQSALSRVLRTSSHRRPLSAAIPSYQPTSPPRVNRRLSDQRETSRPNLDNDSPAEFTSRNLPYRNLAREKAVSVHPGEDLSRRVVSARPSPSTPRTLAFQDMNDAGSYTRRRTSISDANTPRTAPYKQTNLSYGQYRSPAGYNSSPLAPRSEHPLRVEQHQALEYVQGVEGTESTASTTGPSTVWDELDDLKSRINRLELTGKLPPTSGAAMSRVSDERPYTANTTITNISGSPKRTAPGAVASTVAASQVDASSTASGPKETHPVLHAALSKSKTLLSSEVYKALESATTDALGLLNMMGAVGQPGPISSGASTIGGPGVTDRQLRWKADNICRSLTELCLALNEENSRPKTSHGTNAVQSDSPATPTTLTGFTALNPQRRPTAMADQTLARLNTSPRAMSRLEERRTNLLNGTALPSPRLVTPSLATPSEVGAQGRRSSLLLSRRRAGTEEPDEGRTSSLLVRTRRAGTEEPEEARKPSLLLRPRRGTIGEDDDDSRIRAPSRAATEAGPSSRAISRDYSAPGADPNLMNSSALPRRRFGPSSLNSRLAVPASPSTVGNGRRLGEGNANNVVDKLAEERAPRFSLGQTLLGRTTSLSRRNRDSTPLSGSYR
ncbi:hypothetical protein jhhlp_006888 [Lomentospora prolificans]|uniref:LPXTG-motif cell wall anchor domain protein n=1 Tax=Lomentospora prolificans TaxID=41688 RepID=A0A2N3N317_9PEZI|nr:hypothetical protein jhhlp_006888 [Lomentospora prolificans]